MVYVNVVEYTPFDKPTKVTEGKVNRASVVQCQSKHLSPMRRRSDSLVVKRVNALPKVVGFRAGRSSFFPQGKLTGWVGINN